MDDHAPGAGAGCPRCGGPLARFPGDLGGGSRIVTDRDITICGPCCTDEAVRDATGRAPVPPGEWPVLDRLTWASTGGA
ncbi:hypothetical protein ACFY0R_37840 [Streptomyces sp. NPDC001633]|uniref:hypothetical protein n=1 Tax=Streptomyces sp. NPDC001633 TaxID=3364595 RepID=UPI003674183F